jgi:hypothetical protein
MTRLAPAKHDRSPTWIDVPPTVEDTPRSRPFEDTSTDTGPVCGFGPCMRCECREYEVGDGNVCSNCGHGYDYH